MTTRHNAERVKSLKETYLIGITVIRQPVGLTYVATQHTLFALGGLALSYMSASQRLTWIYLSMRSTSPLYKFRDDLSRALGDGQRSCHYILAIALAVATLSSSCFLVVSPSSVMATFVGHAVPKDTRENMWCGLAFILVSALSTFTLSLTVAFYLFVCRCLRLCFDRYVELFVKFS